MSNSKKEITTTNDVFKGLVEWLCTQVCSYPFPYFIIFLMHVVADIFNMFNVTQYFQDGYCLCKRFHKFKLLHKKGYCIIQLEIIFLISAVELLV